MQHARYLIVAFVLALVVAVPASASATPYLGAGEACRQLGQGLHRNYHVVPGTLDCTVVRREARNRLKLNFTVLFQDGDLGWGPARVTEWASHYRWFYRVYW